MTLIAFLIEEDGPSYTEPGQNGKVLGLTEKWDRGRGGRKENEGKQDGKPGCKYNGTWLRWVDAEGTPVPTGRERAESSQRRFADSERLRAETERRLAEAERRLAESERLGRIGGEPPKP
jgi:hypothetical protein